MADGLTPVGVELVAAGASQFVAGVGKAAASLNVLERASKAASAGINALDNIVIGALRRIGEMGVDAVARAGRELVHFGVNVLQAAADGSHLNETLSTLGDRLLGIIRFNIDPLLNQFDALVQKSAPAIEGWVAFLSKSFSQLGQNALTWGENISGQLAQGIYDGAQAVLDALIYIGNLITSWLMPGSPPKLLPDLDDWGREAANVYLVGWTKADFGIFNTLGSEIEGLLRSRAGKNDTGLIPRILGTREAIAQAVQQAREMGQVTAEALDNIYQAAGAVNPEVRDYLKSVFDLDLANAGLTAAQEELNRATEKYKQLLKPVDAELSRISEAQQQLSEDQEKGRLALVLKDPNATASEKRAAQLRIEQIEAERNRRALVAEQAGVVDAAQAKVDAAQQAVDAAQAEYDSKKALIDLQIEQNRLMQEQESLLAKLASAVEKVAKAAGGGKGGGVKPIAFEIPQDLQDKIDALLAKLQTLKTTWETTWEAIKLALKPITDSWEKDVMPAWGRLVDAFTSSLPDIEAGIGKLVDFAVASLGIALPGVFVNVGHALDALTGFWQRHHQAVIDIVVGLFEVIVTTISISMIVASAIIAIALRTIAGSFDAWSYAFKGDWVNFWKTVNKTQADALAINNESARVALDALLLLFGTDLAKIEEAWTGIWNNLQIIVETAVAKIGWVVSGFVGNVISAMASVMTTINPVIAALLQLLALLGQASTVTTGTSGGTVSPPASNSVVSNNSNSSSVTNNYNYSATYQGAPNSPQTDFAIMQVWAR